MLAKSMLLLWIASGFAGAQHLVIRCGTILDDKGNVLHDKDLIIEGAHIARIRDRGGNADYDLSKFTLTPGWIDTHVHFTWSFNH